MTYDALEDLKITYANASPTPCLAPWIALSVKPNGDIGPDAQFEGSYGNLHHRSLQDILSSHLCKELQQSFIEGHFHAACRNCTKKEASLGHSRRIFFEHNFRRFLPNIDQNKQTQPKIQYLDLNLSNKCNLKCRMCNSVSSTLWQQEDRELYKKFGSSLHRPQNARAEKLHLPIVLKLFEDRSLFSELCYVALRGGEPFLEIENFKVLETLIDWKLAPQITLDISTNGTVVTQQMLDLLQHFKQVDLYVSVEGAGALYKYIRGGDSFSIEQLEQNLHRFRQLKNLTIMFSVAVSIYNIFKLDELWDWFESVYQPHDEISFTNAVVRPSYLNFQILPRDLKNKALLRLENSRILEGPHHSGRRLLGDCGKQLLRESLQKDIFSEKERTSLVQQFVCFNNETDRYRSSRLLDIVPELKSLFIENLPFEKKTL